MSIDMRKSAKRRKKRSRELLAAKPYVPTKAEQQALSKLVGGLEQALPHAAAKVEMDGSGVRLSWAHPNQPVAALLWASAIGTTDLAFAGAIFEQLAQVARTGPVLTEKEFNAMLAVVRGLAPADPTEAMLAAQMAAVHNAAMVAARRLVHVETLEQQDSVSAMLNKLMRTFAAQVDTLKRYRLKGEQTIKVQHVTVNDGGRAIVGDVQHAPGGALKSESQCHVLAASHALSPALLGHVQKNPQALPSSRREGAAGVPLPRCASRSAERTGERRIPARPLHQEGKRSPPRRGPAAP